MAAENESPVPSRGLLRRVAGLFGSYRSRLALLSGAILLSSGLGVVNPLLTKVVFDSALFPQGGGDPNVRLLVFLVVIMLLTGALSSAIGVGQTYIASVLGQRVMQDLRNRLYSHLQAMSLRFFTSTRTGEIQSRLQNDVGGIQSVVTDTASTILANIVIIASSLVAMAVLSWQLTLLSLVVVPLFVYLTYRVGRIRRKLRKETQESLAEMSALTEETLSVSGVLLTKVFARTGDAVERYRRENQRLADLQVRQQMVGRTFFALVGTFFSFAPALVYLVSGLAIYYGVGPAISAGTIVAFTALQTRLFFPIGSMLQVSTEIQSSLSLFERIFQYLDLQHEIVDRPGARRLEAEQIHGQVSFRDVSFAYESQVGADVDGNLGPPRRWALEHVDFEVEPGQLAALVGASGAGKTTITYLIPRLYEATDGVVAIDGIDVKDIELGSLAEAVGMVTQETYLFHASVRENLLYARPDATDEQIERAARAALIHDRILELEDGYDTRVGERGYRMSGGEKQRLAIARVLLKDPRILVLDEATSALDTTSERLVQRALEPLKAGRTTIAIAHRLSTIVAADVIFVIDRGRIVERGSHEDLLATRGAYATLYDEQFAGGLVEARCEDGVVLRGGELVELER
jgi:ATP-binding cassette subfamily B protein